MRNKTDANAGVTLLELCIAMITAAMVIGMVFTFWGNLSGNMSGKKRKNILHNEAYSLGSRIVSQLRRSPGIIRWHEGGIVFIASDSTDTISYEFSYNEFRKNDSVVVVVSPGARISDFSIEEIDKPSEKTDVALLRLTVTLADSFSNVCTIKNTVAVKTLPEDPQNKDNGWNFY